MGAMGLFVEDLNAYWRIVAHLFVHANFLHFFWNVVIFIYFAALIENYEPSLPAPLFLVSGVLASLVYFWSSHVVWVGPSGGIFAFIGAYLVLFRQFEDPFKKYLVNPIVVCTIISIATLIQAYFDSIWSAACHTAGCVIGIVLAIYWKKTDQKFARGLSLLCFSAMVLSFGTSVFVASNWTMQDSNALSSKLLTEEVVPEVINQVTWQIANTNEDRPEDLISLATKRQLSILLTDTEAGDFKDTFALLKESVGERKTGLDYRLEVLDIQRSRYYARVVATKMVELEISQYQNNKFSVTLKKTNPPGLTLFFEDRNFSNLADWDINMKKMQRSLSLSFEDIMQKTNL